MDFLLLVLKSHLSLTGFSGLVASIEEKYSTGVVDHQGQIANRRIVVPGAK